MNQFEMAKASLHKALDNAPENAGFVLAVIGSKETCTSALNMSNEDFGHFVGALFKCMYDSFDRDEFLTHVMHFEALCTIAFKNLDIDEDVIESFREDVLDKAFG